MIDVKRIRERSLRVTEGLGIQVISWLPLLDVPVQPRSVDATLDRMLTLTCVAATAHGFDPKKAIAWMQREGLTGQLTDEEREFVFDGVGERGDFMVQVEGLWALAWALGMVSEMDFTKGCPDDFVFLFPNLKTDEDSSAFRKKANPRSEGDCVAALDLAYCLHWAIVQAGHDRKPLNAQLTPYVIIERRRALEWLLSDDEWDDVSMDT